MLTTPTRSDFNSWSEYLLFMIFLLLSGFSQGSILTASISERPFSGTTWRTIQRSDFSSPSDLLFNFFFLDPQGGRLEFGVSLRPCVRISGLLFQRFLALPADRREDQDGQQDDGHRQQRRADGAVQEDHRVAAGEEHGAA